MGGPEDMEGRIDRWAAQARETAARYQNLTTAMNAITGRATGANGAITVEVNHAGIPTRLDLTDDIRTMRGGYLAGQIMTTIARAQSTLGDKITELMREHVPGDEASITSITDAYARQFPDPETADVPSTGRSPHENDDFGGPIMR